HGGEERAQQYADPGLLSQSRPARKGKRADEQAHRETDAAEQGDSVDLKPGRAARPPGPAEADAEPDRAENAGLLAGEQAERDGERQRREPGARAAPGQRHAGIGEAEQEQDREGDPGRQSMLEPV